MEFFLVSLLNGIAYGLLLFMLCGGLTLILGMMGVLNFAHASFYMLGAYLAYQFSLWAGFWIALIAAPFAVGLFGLLFERLVLRHVHRQGHAAELLVTFGLASIIAEVVQLVWGRSPVPYRVPPELDGVLFTLYQTSFPVYRGFMMAVALLMLVAMAVLLRCSRMGLVIQAALDEPRMVEALGHNLPRVFLIVFAGGAALAGLAGVIGGNAFVTDPGMATSLGSIVFVVVVVGGLGSLSGALAASMLIGLLQTFAVAYDTPLGALSLARVAPVLPYLLMVCMLVLRPRGLLGRRE